MPERFEVRTKEAEQRLDKLIRQRFPALSFGQTQKLIRGGRVRVDGKRSKAADRVSLGAIVTLPYQGGRRQVHQERLRLFDDIKLYQDAEMIVINKPAGLAVQGGSAVKHHIAKMIDGTDLKLVHRLDKDTSGVLILANGALTAKILTRNFADQTVEKKYLAVVPRVSRDEGTIKLPVVKLIVGGEGRMAIAQSQQASSQEAITNFEVLDRNSTGVLVQLSPKTGRTHQLRVHSAHVFGGIYGDTKYGSSKDHASTLLLHAWRVQLPHPSTEESLSLEAAPPDTFLAALRRLNLNLPQTWKPV
ncbi:MAG: RluA family pseudouridine synthase [Alphaproteobacteria bacterium]